MPRYYFELKDSFEAETEDEARERFATVYGCVPGDPELVDVKDA